MKILKLLILIILFTTPKCFSQNFNIVGKWVGSDADKNIGYLILEENGFASIEVQGQVLGGEKFMLNETEANLKYKVNYEASPIELELTLSTVDYSKVLKKLYFIVEILNENEINLALNADDLTKKPLAFTLDNIIHFSRSN